MAEHLEWTYPPLNEIVNMHRGVTSDSALAFSEAFGMEPEFGLIFNVIGIYGTLEKPIRRYNCYRKQK